MNRWTDEGRAPGLARVTTRVAPLVTLMPLVPLVPLILALVWPMAAQAQWKWRDKTGQTQYSDLPPPNGTDEHDILQSPRADARRAAPPLPTPSAAALLAPRSSEPELEARRRKVEQDEMTRKIAEDARVAAVRGENCNRAKAQMRTLDSGMRMSVINEKGEREVLDDAARAAESKRTRAVMAADCK